MSDPAGVGVDRLTLTIYGTDTSLDQLSMVRDLYAEIYAEPPYHEGPADVQDFASGWHRTIDQRNFRLVIARRADEPIGFAFGLQLRARTQWWKGAVTPLPDEITTEYPGRTFAIIELAVRRPYRQHGVGRRLHTHLTAGLSEERITLLVRPEAPAPQQAYLSWGYRPVGQIQPFPGAPVYTAMIKQFRSPRDTATTGQSLSLLFNLFWSWWTWWWRSCRRRVGGRTGGLWSRVGVLVWVVRVWVRWRGGWFSAGGSETRGGCGRG